MEWSLGFSCPLSIEKCMVCLNSCVVLVCKVRGCPSGSYCNAPAWSMEEHLTVWGSVLTWCKTMECFTAMCWCKDYKASSGFFVHLWVQQQLEFWGRLLKEKPYLLSPSSQAHHLLIKVHYSEVKLGCKCSYLQYLRSAVVWPSQSFD